jgi:hypothetical protein
MLTRMLDEELRTILIDEADRSLNPQKDGYADLMAVLNSGYKRGSTRPVLVPTKGGGWEVKEMPTFSPVALAGNNPTLPDDTRSRIIRVLLMPDHSGLIEESDWERIEGEANALHDSIAAWADQVREHVKHHRPDLPKGIVSRFREKWAPLKRVADAAGGDWSKKTDEMALNDRKEWELDRQDGLLRETPAVVLLRHVWNVWPVGVSFLPSEDLVRRLIWEHPEMWGETSTFGKDLTSKRLGSMLTKAYKIHSDQPVRGGPRGYHHASFTRPWHRMGVGPASDASDASDAGEGSTRSDESPTIGTDNKKNQGGSYTPAYKGSHPLQESDASDASDAGPPFYTCKSCPAGLWAPESQERGVCERCYMDGASTTPITMG